MRIRINRLLTSPGRGGLEGGRPSSSPNIIFSRKFEYPPLTRLRPAEAGISNSDTVSRHQRDMQFSVKVL